MMAGKRELYDLSHYIFKPGWMGRLQTLDLIPVIAGDSFDINLAGVARLSPLRRNLTLDARLDIYAFYIPYRHIYGDDWLTFIKDGVDETTTFGGYEVGGITPVFLGTASTARTLPKWIPQGFMDIYNRYFKAPSEDDYDWEDDFQIPDITTVERQLRRLYGPRINGLKRVWNTGVKTTVTDDDHKLEVSVSSSKAKIDIIELEKVRARYRTEQARDWFARRYNDILGETWGSRVNIDADERPELLNKQSYWLSGYDVDATSAENLGSYSGKSAGTFNFSMPRKYFDEHGTIWLMASCRFPEVHNYEVHYLEQKTEPTYKEIAGDFDIVAAEPPQDLVYNDWFAGVGATQIKDGTKIPYGQWYREHPNRSHVVYELLEGYPFRSATDFVANNTKANRYSTPPQGMFLNEQLGQWHINIRANMQALRHYPGALRSIFAGAS